MRMRFWPVIVMFGCLVSYPVSSPGQEENRAQESSRTLEPVVVTGSAYPSELSKSTGSVTVITEED
ncbi:MAG: hypothetical protein F9K51_00005, partial [Candidatus Dadabacteria bacterium]